MTLYPVTLPDTVSIEVVGVKNFPHPGYRMLHKFAWARPEAVARRSAIRVHGGTKRLTGDEYYEDTLGLQAEQALPRWLGFKRNNVPLGHSDGGIDCFAYFPCSGRTVTIDVKGYRQPYHILVKPTDMARGLADVLILALVEGDWVTFLGWEYGGAMKLCDRKDFGMGYESWKKHRDEIKPLEWFFNLPRVDPLRQFNREPSEKEIYEYLTASSTADSHRG